MGAIQVAQLLRKDSSSQSERTWETCFGAKPTLCHIRPALSTDPKDRKITFLVRAELDSRQCREIGEYLIWIAEDTRSFEQPIRPMERKVVGRTWEVDNIGERKKANNGSRLYPRMAFMTPFERANGQRYARVTCNADLTPRIAREMGVYLLALAAQVD